MQHRASGVYGQSGGDFIGVLPMGEFFGIPGDERGESAFGEIGAREERELFSAVLFTLACFYNEPSIALRAIVAFVHVRLFILRFGVLPVRVMPIFLGKYTPESLEEIVHLFFVICAQGQ
jgi:hypothetical protein